MNCIVASGPVIIENGKVLLNRHGDNPEEQNMWKFVGGRVEESEISGFNALENTCKREVREEMGIDLADLIPIKPLLIPHPHKNNTFVVLIHYLAKRIGKIKPGKDIVEWNWFDIQDLPEGCAPNVKPVMEEYRRIKGL